MNKYLKFEYWNTCDLGNIYYQGGQKFMFYLDADVGEPLHEDIEEGQENGDGDFIPTYRRQIKRYRIRTGLIPDFLIDAMQRMKLHDNIELTFKTGEIEKIYNVDIEPEWQFEKYAWQGTVTMTFDMDESITVGACCDNLVLDDIEPIPEFYWISPLGSDATGDGSNLRPWATLAYACTQAVSVGDVIHVAAGNYTETARAALSVGVSILGDSTNIPVITYTYAASGTRDGAIYLNSAAGAPVNGNQSISYINLNGSSLTSNRAIAVNYRYNVDVHHCTIEDFDRTGVWFYVSPSYAHATGNSIHDCIINNSSSAVGGYAGCIRFEGQDGFLCYNNTIDMRFRAAGANAASMNSDNNLRYQIYDNTFYRNDHEDDDWNFFMEMWSYEGDCQIYNNTFYGLATLDFAFGPTTLTEGTTYGLKVYNNRMINGTNGIYTKPTDTKAIIGITIEGDGHQSVYIYNNLIQRYGWGIEIASAGSSTGGTWEQDWHFNDIHIYNNVIENTGYSDYQYCYGILYLNETNSDGYTVETDNLHILNNTITAISGSTYQGIRFSGGDALSNLNIKNNIVKGFDSYGIYLGEHATDGFSMTNVAVTYNCMNGNGTNTVGIDGDIVQTNFDVATGNITGDPLFVSATDFHLQAGSPCINAGVYVGLTTDYDGRPVANPPEIGAYEYYE